MLRITALLFIKQGVSFNLEAIEDLQLLQMPQQVVDLVFFKEIYLKLSEIRTDCLQSVNHLLDFFQGVAVQIQLC